MVEVAAGDEVDVDVRAHAVRHRLEEPLQHRQIHRAARALLELDVPVQVRAAGEVDHAARERLVEREVEASGARDAFAVAQRLVERLAQRDAGVLDRVVLVDVQIALAAHLQRQRGMLGERLEHVVEERNPGIGLSLAVAVEVEGDPQVGLLRLPLHGAVARHRQAPVSASKRESARVVSPGPAT